MSITVQHKKPGRVLTYVGDEVVLDSDRGYWPLRFSDGEVQRREYHDRKERLRVVESLLAETHRWIDQVSK